MAAKPGDRVGAISHSEGDTYYLLGYGVYTGDFVPETACGVLGSLLRMNQVPNPKIVLDNGQVVWGCECWWALEDEVREQLEGRTVVESNIEDLRKDVRGNPEEGVPEDAEYVEILQKIEGDFPNLEKIKTILKSVVSDYAGESAADALQDVTSDLLETLNFLRSCFVIKGLSQFSAEIADTELEVNLGVVMPDDKVVDLTLVLKNPTTNPS